MSSIEERISQLENLIDQSNEEPKYKAVWNYDNKVGGCIFCFNPWHTRQEDGTWKYTGMNEDLKDKGNLFLDLVRKAYEIETGEAFKVDYDNCKHFEEARSYWRVYDFIFQAIKLVSMTDFTVFYPNEWIDIDDWIPSEVISLLSKPHLMEFVLLQYLDVKMYELELKYERYGNDKDFVKKFLEILSTDKQQALDLIENEQQMNLIYTAMEIKNIEESYTLANKIVKLTSKWVLSINPDKYDLRHPDVIKGGRWCGHVRMPYDKYMEEDYQDFKIWLAGAEKKLGRKFQHNDPLITSA